MRIAPSGDRNLYPPEPTLSFLELTQECIDTAQGVGPIMSAARKDRPLAMRVFKNDFVEHYLARAHWATPALWFFPIIGFGFYRGFTGTAGIGGTLGLFLVGWLVWTLSEYLLHRYLFHLSAHTPEERQRAFLMHGYHHDFPNDRMRLVAPPVMSWGPAIIFAVLYYFTFGPSLFAPVLAGTAAGYLAYDWIHYYTHHARPKYALGKFLRRYHMLHHHGDGNAWYGVSSPLWDLILGTYRKTTP